MRTAGWLKGQQGKRFVVSAIATLVSVPLAVLAVNVIPWLGYVELRLTPAAIAPASPDIVIVTQTKATLAKLGEVGAEPDAPLPRRVFADLLTRLDKAQARVVLMDYDFSERLDDDQNNRVREVLANLEHTRVVLGHVPVSGQTLAEGEPSATFKGNFLKPPLAPERVDSGSLLPWNPDQVIRGLFLRIKDPETDEFYWHVAARTAAIWKGFSLDEMRFDPDRYAFVSKGIVWPVGLNFEYRTQWTSDPKPFETIEFSEALSAPSERFRDKIVIVGSSVDTREYFGTEQFGVMVGHDLIAQFVNSLCVPAEKQVREGSILSTLTLAAFLGFLSALIASGLKPLQLLSGAAIAIGGGLLAPRLSLLAISIRLETTAPILAALLSLGLATGYFGVRLKKFDPLLGRTPGEEVEAAIMFVDLKGSTAAISGMELNQVRAMLGSVLEGLIGSIRKRGGTIERTMGDGVFALWVNQDGDDDSHVDGCLAAVFDFEDLIAHLDAETRAAFDRSADLTVGVEVGVISGDIVKQQGHEEWSWFGAPIHLTARLQSYCGQVGTRVCVGPEFAKRVEGAARIESVGSATMKGFPEPVPVFTVAPTEQSHP